MARRKPRGGKDHPFSAPRGKKAPYGGLVIPTGQKLGFKGPPVRTLDDMTREEIRAIEAEYGAKVLPRKQRKLRKSRQLAKLKSA
jgi:hypothetical protein